MCVAPVKGRLKDLHADMVACLLLLCGAKEVEPQHLPSTLRVALFPERYSVSGRARFDPVAEQRRRDVQAPFSLLFIPLNRRLSMRWRPSVATIGPSYGTRFVGRIIVRRREQLPCVSSTTTATIMKTM